MQSATTTSNGSGKALNGLAAASNEPSHLTAGAIKRLSDATTVKHHYKLDYVLQITRIKDLSKP